MGNRLSKAEASQVNNLNPGMQFYGVGNKLKAALDNIGPVGDIYYLDPTNGDDGNDGFSPDAAKKTLAAGYALLVDGANDVLVYIAGASAITLTTGFTWAKSYAHFIGICSPVPVAQRCRIFLISTATAKTFLFKNTGEGNYFENLHIFMGVNDTTASYSVVDSGQRCYWKNVHFAGIGHTAMDVASAGSLLIDGGGENVYDSCAIGLDTVTRGANSRELVLKTASTRLTFKDCLIYSYISAAGHALVKIFDGTGIDRWIEFIRCKFQADSTNRSTALTSVFDIPSGIAQGMIVLEDCKLVSWGAAAAWDSSARGIISNNQVAAAASAGGGVMTHL